MEGILSEDWKEPILDDGFEGKESTAICGGTAYGEMGTGVGEAYAYGAGITGSG